MNRSRARSAPSRESGLSLLEVIVAIAILTVVATASGTLALTGMAAGATQERRQVAVTIASGVMESLSAQTIATSATTGVSGLYTGSTSVAVTAAWLALSSAPGVAQTYPGWDPTATTLSTPTIPITTYPTQVGTNYTVTTLIGTCFQPTAGGDCGRLVGQIAAPALPPTGYTGLIRAIVVVSWTAGKTCASGCSYTTSTLIDPSNDLAWVSHG